MQEASATRRDTAERPGRSVPSGCPWAGRLLWRRSSPCSRHGIVAPSRIHPGPGSNAPRALPGPDPTMRGAARRAMRCHRGRAATKQMAPNPLRPGAYPRMERGRDGGWPGCMARKRARSDVGHRMSELTRPGARPAPSLRARAAGLAGRRWPPLKRHHPVVSRPPRGSGPQGSLARRLRLGMHREAGRGGDAGPSPTSPNKAVRPRRCGPLSTSWGCLWAGHLPCRPSATCPPARLPRASSNLLRPRGQRAESPWGPEPQPCSPGTTRRPCSARG